MVKYLFLTCCSNLHTPTLDIYTWKKTDHKPIMMGNNSGFMHPNTISLSVRQNLAARNFPWDRNGCLPPGELLFFPHHIQRCHYFHQPDSQDLFLSELKLKFKCSFVEKAG